MGSDDRKNSLHFTKSEKSRLHQWFCDYHRPLPWREQRLAYNVWISETMLQQTTTTAVVPFYNNFIKRFPTLSALAKADEQEVLESWAGLGYYSRARNLLKAAQQLNKEKSFPTTFEQLLNYPGIGPYTSRAVASIAFDQPVGVLDGNVIRILCRKFNLDWQWWKTQPRKKLQDLADQCVAKLPAHQMNQAMMELGATICTPSSPKCVSCPWLKTCAAHKAKTIEHLPLKKPKKAKEIWVWKPQLHVKGDKIALTQKSKTPFLKNQWLPPGEAKLSKAKPKHFDFSHSITHHQIYVIVESHKSELKTRKLPSDVQWVQKDSLAQWNPSSLIKKTMQT